MTKTIQIIKQLLILWGATFLLGLLGNQLLPEGIHYRFILPKTETGGATYQIISVDSAATLLNAPDVTFIDVRSKDEYAIDHVPGAISIPLTEYFKNPTLLNSLEPNHMYIVYCFDPGCVEGEQLSRELSTRGLNKVYYLVEGFSKWIEYGLPVETGEE
ncbi:MAG: rhodanese-like domain-containing protein [Calditrichaeota bacterium]|nr:MAG: rhodanese-like domain-containing protein [Calditrichota bacterium]